MDKLELKHAPWELLEYYQDLRKNVLEKALLVMPAEVREIHGEFLRDMENVLKYVSKNAVNSSDIKAMAFFDPHIKGS